MLSVKNNIITFHASAVIGNYVYYSSLNFNGLYRYDLLNKTNTFLGYFINESRTDRHLHGAAISVNNKILFAPLNGKNICIYDIEKGIFHSIELREEIKDINSKFFDIVCQGNIAYLIPSRAGYIVKINTDTFDIEYHCEWKDYVDLSRKKEIPEMKNGSFIYNNQLYIPYGRENIIFRIDLKNFHTSTIRIGNSKNGFVDAIYDENEDLLWLLECGQERLLSFSIKEERITYYDFPVNENIVKYPYIKMINNGNKIFIPAYQQNCSIVFEKKKAVCSKIDFEDKEKQELLDWGAYHYSAVRINEDIIWITNTGTYKIIQLNNHLDITDIISLSDNYYQRIMSDGAVIHRETNNNKLADYIHYIYERNTNV